MFIIFWQKLERALWEKREVYFRFLKSCIPSIVVTYWNPASMSFVVSCAVVAPVHIYSSALRFPIDENKVAFF